MIRVVAALVGAAISCAAMAQEQEMVLRHSAPVYKFNAKGIEQGPKGKVVSLEGSVFALRQHAQREGRQTMLHYVTVAERNITILRAKVEPRSGRIWSEDGGSKIRTQATSCTELHLYPIVLGKVHECHGYYQTDNESLMLESRRTRYYSAEFRAVKGKPMLTEYCTLEEQFGEELVRVMRVCYSPDGKWIRLRHILSLSFMQRL